MGFLPQCHGPRLGIDVSRIDCIDIQLLSAGVTNVIQPQAVRGIAEEVVCCDVDGVFKLCGWKWNEVSLIANNSTNYA